MSVAGGRTPRLTQILDCALWPSGQETGALKWEKPIEQKAQQESPVMSSRPSQLGLQDISEEMSKTVLASRTLTRFVDMTEQED